MLMGDTHVVCDILQLPPLARLRLKVAHQGLVVMGSAVNDGIRGVHMRQVLVEAVAAEGELDDLHSRVTGLLKKLLDLRNKDSKILRDDLRVTDDHVDGICKLLSRSL